MSVILEGKEVDSCSDETDDNLDDRSQYTLSETVDQVHNRVHESIDDGSTLRSRSTESCGNCTKETIQITREIAEYLRDSKHDGHDDIDYETRETVCHIVWPTVIAKNDTIRRNTVSRIDQVTNSFQ